MKKSQKTQESTSDQLEVVLIKKTNGVFSKQIKLKLPEDTSFGSIIKFMHQEGLLRTKNALIRPSSNESYVLGNNRKISECVGLIKLKFIVEELQEGKSHPGEKGPQAFRGHSNVEKDTTEKSNICGREECSIM